DVHDHGRRLHARVRVLQRDARHAGRARRGRAGSSRSRRRGARPRIRRRHVRRSRRSARLRRRRVCRHHPRDQSPPAPVPGRGGESRLPGGRGAPPDVLNPNTETVPRLHRIARPGGRYPRAIELLDRARKWAPDIPTKTGLMVGLGESWDELVAVFRDLRGVDCRILTIGQYLRPSVAHLPMTRYYTPDEFRELKRVALDLGFGHVESGPLVRSSYHAHEQAESYAAQTGV